MAPAGATDHRLYCYPSVRFRVLPIRPVVQWVSQFEKAADIETILREQFGILFGASLEYRAKFARVSQIDFGDLSGSCLRLITDMPNGWEYLLFGRVAQEEIDKLQELRYNLRHGLGAGMPTRIRPDQLREWLVSKTDEFRRLLDLGNRIIHGVLPEAIGKSGEDGDPVLVVRAARQLALLHKRILYWSLEYQDLTLGEEFEKLMSSASNCAVGSLDNIEEFVVNIQSAIDRQAKLPAVERDVPPKYQPRGTGRTRLANSLGVR